MAAMNIKGGGENVAQNEATIAIIAEGRRLYIGNLAYEATYGNLGEFFEGYQVTSVSIPVKPRTSRPVGYAFVDVSTATEAQRAISELSGKELLDRKISIQLARKPNPAAKKAETVVSGGDGVSGGGNGRKRKHSLLYTDSTPVTATYPPPPQYPTPLPTHNQIMTLTPAATPQPLSFPRLTYAKLSPSPFLHAHLTSIPPLRPNARAPTTFRSPVLNTGSLTHANGSAVVRAGDTAVVCGIRAEILRVEDIGDWRPVDATREGRRRRRGEGGGEGSKLSAEGQRQEREEMAHLGLLVPNIELATGCSPAFMPGNPPSTLAQSLSHRILTLLGITSLIRLDDLEIWHQPDTSQNNAKAPMRNVSMSTGAGGGEDRMETSDPDSSVDESGDAAVGGDEEDVPQVKALWTLYIDILFISLDGNPFDAAWAAVLAALQDTRLPRAWWDADQGIVLCSPLVSQSRRLSLRGCPIASTFGVFEKGKEMWVLADPDDFEEGLCEESVTIVVDEVGGKGRVLRIEKSGGGAVGVEEMRGAAEMAGGRWRDWRGVLGKE